MSVEDYSKVIYLLDQIESESTKRILQEGIKKEDKAKCRYETFVDSYFFKNSYVQFEDVIFSKDLNCIDHKTVSINHIWFDNENGKFCIEEKAEEFLLKKEMIYIGRFYVGKTGQESR